MEKMMEKIRMPFIAAVVLALILGLNATPSFAAAPTTESVKYLGNGVVEVEFRQDVRYKNVKVSVQNESGEACSASIRERDDDELKFRIKNCTKGTTYSFTITGIKKARTSGYGKVTGTVKVPTGTGKTVTRAEAINIALKDAGVTLDDLLYDPDVERDRTDGGVAVYEISFETEDYEYDYEIAIKDGAILNSEKEPYYYDDDYYDDGDIYDDADTGTNTNDAGYYDVNNVNNNVNTNNGSVNVNNGGCYYGHGGYGYGHHGGYGAGYGNCPMYQDGSCFVNQNGTCPFYQDGVCPIHQNGTCPMYPNNSSAPGTTI